MDGIPVDQQIIKFGKRGELEELDDQGILSDYKIVQDSIVYMLLKLRGS